MSRSLFAFCIAFAAAATLADGIVSEPSETFAVQSRSATTLYEAPQGFEASVAPQTQVVFENPLAQCPEEAARLFGKSDRLYLEIWGGDTGEAIAAVLVSGSKNGESAKKEFRRFDLPQNGLRAMTLSLGGIGKEVDFTSLSNIIVRVEGLEPRPFAIARVLLLSKGEARPEIAEAPRVHPLDAAEHHADYVRFRDECRQNIVVAGYATSMEAVRPRAGFKWKPIHDIYVRLARGERESFQVLVAPTDGDLKDVSIEVDMGEGSAFSNTNFSVGVVGYVETKTPPWPYVVRPEMKKPSLGWWPDAILDFQKTTDIKGEDVQSFWVRVTCPTNQPAGDYVGYVRVKVRGKQAEKGVLHLHVNDFSVGRVAPLPMIVSFDPDLMARDKLKRGEIKEEDDYHFAWKTRKEAYCDWLADYYVTWCDYYHHFQHWDMLVRLKEQGRLNLFNLGFWWRADGSAEDYRKRFVPGYRKDYEKAKELGLLDHAILGGCSEQLPQFHKTIAKAVDILREEFPEVPIISSAQDFRRGTDGSPLKNLDASIAVINRYHPEIVKKARAEGRKVWWYICNWPNAPWINGILEDPPCQLRVLMGALTQKCKPDGFLYWAIASWPSEKPITSGPWTDWNPNTFGSWHGDGQWTACGGPDLMPLATLRLENFRDGIEDLWYAKLLEEKLKEVEGEMTGGTGGTSETGGDVPQVPTVPQVASPVPPVPPAPPVQLSAGEPPAPPGNGGQPSNRQTVKLSNRAAWAQRARAALAVPDELAKDGKDFSVNPEVIYRWRNEMADLIEEAQ